jgi:DNA modification methylase
VSALFDTGPEMKTNTILVGDCLASLRTLPAGCVQTCVTSPPYWGLRDYGCEGQIGQEATPEEFTSRLTEVFREVRRVLRDDGTCWLNLGDSYATGGGAVGRCPGGGDQGERFLRMGHVNTQPNRMPIPGLKAKDLVGIPWRVAFALQADGWWLRQEIIWAKPNPMPESVTDRCTKAHEQIFLLTKSRDYFYDADAIKEEAAESSKKRLSQPNLEEQAGSNRVPGKTNGPMKAVFGGRNKHEGYGTRIHSGREDDGAYLEVGANKRSVWTVSTQSYKAAHFSTFPAALIKPMILAGTSERGCCPTCRAPWERITERTKVTRERPNDYTKRTGEDGTGNSCANSVAGVSVATTGWQPTCECNAGEPIPCVVLDPFGGSGTTGQVARSLGRDYILCELNPDYVALAEKRIRTPLYSDAPKAVKPLDGQRELFGETA